MAKAQRSETLPIGGKSGSKSGKPDRWFKPQKPDFVKLAIGEVLTGVYLGRQSGQYGDSYKFQNDGKITCLSGNRVSIDGLMDQVDAANMKGHLLTVERVDNERSQRGRDVHQYRVGHISQGCPQCDRSAKV